MTTTAKARKPGVLKRRRIIQRPRLIALLDGSKARVRTLVAPAGYGKTTLAEQWVEQEGRRGAWFRARRSSTDVAALALGLAQASAELIPGCDERLRDHLRALPAPAENVDLLAELLGEDLEAWPSDGWLVLDDYQEIASAEEAEHFVSALVAASPLRLIVASRQRPTWVTQRRILYGEVLELTKKELAMTSDEAGEMLAERNTTASRLVGLASGWPAVIGLASVSTAEIRDDESVPESLCRFFAEEVISSLGDDVQAGVATLALAPVIDRTLAIQLLGPEAAPAICDKAIDVGILVERGAHLEIHPLARSFFEDRLHLAASTMPENVDRCLHHYSARGDWDAAFDLVARRGQLDRLEVLLKDAMDDLLDTARLSTIEAWCTFAWQTGLDGPAFSLARAEVLLRQGRLNEAHAHALAAASIPSEHEFRSLTVAGRAAHLASREEEALESYRRAETVAPTEAARRDALWSQLACLTELELPEATALEADLSNRIVSSDPRQVVRAAAIGLMYRLRFGTLDLSDADRASALLPAVIDPLVVTSFRTMYSNTLALASRYKEALEVASALMATATRYGLDFASVYGQCTSAMAYAGLRDWALAETHAREAIVAARARHDTHAEQFGFAVQIRTYAQQGKHQLALQSDIPDLGSALPGARAEVLGSLALVLASAGRVDEAFRRVTEIGGTTNCVDSAVLVAATRAVASLKRRDHRAVDDVLALEETAFRTGAVDILVVAYRSTPELLAVLLRGSHRQDRFLNLMRRVGDDDLAAAAGYPIAGADLTTQLSHRERDVYQLLRQGLTNRQIAKLLFIEESTVKVHTHHIYDKLGVRSRTALAVQAALERADQTTSASAATGADVGRS